MKGDPVHLGKGFHPSGPILGNVSRLLSGIDDTVDTVCSTLLFQARNNKEFLKVLESVDFDYIELILKKMIRKIEEAEGFDFPDFILDESSVKNKRLPGSTLGRAYSDNNAMDVDFYKTKKEIEKFDLPKEDLVLNITETIVHESLHLLAGKDAGTGFQAKKGKTFQYEALNEGMTELLARAVTRKYYEFTREKKGPRSLLNAYGDEVERLIALLAIVAKETGVSIEAVIQSFTVSYFHGNDVVQMVREVVSSNKEGLALVEKLTKEPIKPKDEEEYEAQKFLISEVGEDKEFQELVTSFIETQSRLTLSALRLDEKA